MQLTPRILQASDLEQIYQLEKKPGDMEAEMASWSASWRRESLEHYLPLGWSFGLFDDETLVAYALAQPQLFVHGLTQNLWFEHFLFQNDDQAGFLLDLLYRTCREKHFQSLRLKEDSWLQWLPANIKAVDEPLKIHTFKTAKF